MFGKKNEKLETLKDLIGSREGYLDTVKMLELDKNEKDIFLLASIEVRKKNPNLDIIDEAHAILVEKSFKEEADDTAVDEFNTGVSGNNEDNDLNDPKDKPDSKESTKGSEQTYQFCTNCGNKLDMNVKFCTKCGEKIIKNNNESTKRRGHKTNTDSGEEENLFTTCFVNVIRYQYNNFEGRTSRKKYWCYALFQIIVSIALILTAKAINTLLGYNGDSDSTVLTIFLLANVALFLPTIAIGARRLHDINKSGWLMLISLIPYVGIFVLLFLLSNPSVKENNNY